MENVTIRLKVEILRDGEDGEVAASQENVWKGLSGQQVLFIERHLLDALSGINKEASELMDKMLQTNIPEAATPGRSRGQGPGAGAGR